MWAPFDGTCPSTRCKDIHCSRSQAAACAADALAEAGSKLERSEAQAAKALQASQAAAAEQANAAEAKLEATLAEKAEAMTEAGALRGELQLAGEHQVRLQEEAVSSDPFQCLPFPILHSY